MSADKNERGTLGSGYLSVGSHAACSGGNLMVREPRRISNPRETHVTRQKGYDSNLASEFWVLSCLHRLGKDATLSLGNKKTVDLQLIREDGMVVTIDVKASATKADWIAGKLVGDSTVRHFVVLVGYEGKIGDLEFTPRVWVVPYKELAQFVKTYKGNTRCVRRSLIDQGASHFENAWPLLWSK